jgi:phosphoribosylaminoimidazole synthetase
MPEAVGAYAASGVDIDAGNRAVALMAAAVRTTYGPEVLGGIGAFGGLYDASGLKSLTRPVLVASTDGVGTKVSLAAAAKRYRSIGHDIVNHCVNDILVQGARPLFFLDYIASARVAPAQVADMVGGMAEACRAAGCALLGGETAEMPGVYAREAFDVAGTIVGVVEAARRLPRPDVAAGDVIVALASSGPHTNGYSLIRRVFAGADLDAPVPELGTSLADALLAPHRSYLGVLWPLLQQDDLEVKALAHITGGGLVENLPRVLPETKGAVLWRGSWPVPPLFGLIQARGAVADDEMNRVFNMGLGMLAIISPGGVPALRERLGEESWVVGEVVAGPPGVRFT